MATVRRLLQIKGKDVWSVSPEDTILTALQIMKDKNIGALVVLEGGKVVGIVSERDFARKACSPGGDRLDLPVRDVMTSPVYYISPAESMEQVMAIMTEKHIRHLPVLDKDRLVGIISIGDVVKEVISDREFIIENLERYITGRK